MPDPGSSSKPQAAADDADDGIDAEVAALIRSGPFETMILDTPPSEFDTAKLVEALTSPYIADDGAGGVALDPHALKKLFSTVSAMLSTMEAEAAEQTAELEQDAESVEDDYRGGLSQHQSTLELLSANLARVDERFRKVTADAVRIGDSLGRKEAQRARAADAIELLEHFKVFDELPEGFADGGGAALAAAARARLPAVFADEDRRMEAARVLSRLRAISFELDAPGLGRAAGNMRAYADFLEAELLDLFERAAGRAPPEAEFMRECADILYALNEGDHLQGRYVYGVVSRRLAHGGAAVAEGGLGAAGGGADQVRTAESEV
ncbi:exocyst complex component Sec10-domain-containing protein [Tribonema minus]|uniref:Exocyst complex component Sec10-domain-containing protein n=1 Tax=Tribonema minus TaxID=303371 RepID=A0A836C6X2_9STRA|nr:exocyst complex component Sec10-domain-containing protein [Tribonema minus]